MSKTTPIRVRMTEEEISALEGISEVLTGRVNISRVVRKATRDFLNFGPDLLDLQMTEFRLAVRQLTGVARNLNQLTKAVNADSKNLSRISIETYACLSKSVDKLNDSLTKIIVHTKQRKGGVIEH